MSASIGGDRRPHRPLVNPGTAKSGARTIRRRIIAHLGFIFGLGLLLGLGIWQVARREWKTQLIAARSAMLAASPLALTGEQMPDDFQPVEITGRWSRNGGLTLENQTLLEPGRVIPSDTVGRHLLVPLLRTHGPPILVDRGFIGQKYSATANDLSDTTTTIIGWARLAPHRHYFTPVNHAERGEWYWLDLPAIAAVTQLPLETRYYIIAAARSGQTDGPIGGQLTAELPNDHLQYALTWFSLAAILAILYGKYLFVARRNDR